MDLCPEAEPGWAAPDQHCSLPVHLHQQHEKDNSSREWRVTVQPSLSPGTDIKAGEVHPTFESVTQTVVTSKGDSVEHKFCFAAPVLSQLGAATGVILLSNTAGDSHAQLWLWHSPITLASLSSFLHSSRISNPFLFLQLLQFIFLLCLCLEKFSHNEAIAIGSPNSQKTIPTLW